MRTLGASLKSRMSESTTVSPTCKPLRISISPMAVAAELDGHAHGVVVAHDVDEPRVRIAERAAATLSTSLRSSSTMRTEARWFWRRPCGCSLEPHAARHLALRTSGEMPATVPMSLRPSSVTSAFMPGRDLVGIALGDLEFDFERGEVHDGHQRRVLRDLRAFLLRERRDDAGHGRLERERVDALACRRATLSDCASRVSALAAQLELQAVLLEAAGCDGVRVVELGGLEIVLRARSKSRSGITWMPQASSARLNSRSAAVICTLARSLSWLLLRIWRRTSMAWRLSAASALTSVARSRSYSLVSAALST